jgi:type IV fimbrial biogenesis protein FimT
MLASQAGHTLIELVSAVAVVLILLGNALPSFSAVLAGYALKGAARQVFSDFQRTRMAAVTENNRYIVTFTNSHTYTVHDDANNNGTVDAGETVNTFDLQKDWPGVTVTTTSNTVTFYPDASVSGAITMTVTNSRSATSTVTVNDAGNVGA